MKMPREYLIICKNYSDVVNTRELFIRFLKYKADIGEFLVDKKKNTIHISGGCKWRFVDKAHEEQALQGFRGTSVFSSNDMTRMIMRELNITYGYPGGNKNV